MTLQTSIIEDLARFTRDPYGFVLWAFPWGEEGPLKKALGPEPWQRDFLLAIGKDINTLDSVLRYATASGHNIGKSTIVSWLTLWAVSTHEDTRGVITANTETQLMTKTMPELAKWYRMFLARDLFHLAATSIYSRDPEHERTWRVDFIPWSERNPEAFAGLHNQGKRIIIIFDEASTIDDSIWSTTEGALTDANTEIIWTVFGNPTRNTGAFYDCFHGKRSRWKTQNIDSRTVSIANHTLHNEWVEDYGEDSDFVRIRVKGEFPRQGALEFIPAASVREAMTREVSAFAFDPVILGVDVARYGDDATVIYQRQGRDGKNVPPIIIRNQDTMFVAGKVAELFHSVKPDAIFIDAGGVGGGVVDRLAQLRIPHIGVDFGAKADGSSDLREKQKYANKRSEMWGAMRDWLKTGGIPSMRELEQELLAPQYFYQDRSNAIILEGKKEMKRRGAASPNIADALALTFAYPVGPRVFSPGFAKPRHQTDYDPFEGAYR